MSNLTNFPKIGGRAKMVFMSKYHKYAHSFRSGIASILYILRTSRAHNLLVKKSDSGGPQMGCRL